MEGRKAIFATLGVALFVAGLALAGSAIGAIVDAPAKRNLIVEWVILGIAVVIFVAGSYVFAAALSDRLPLLGMKAVRRAAREHTMAVLLLTMAVHRGNSLAEAPEVPEVPFDQISEWVLGVLAFIGATWGEREEAFIRGSLREMPKAGTHLLPRSHQAVNPCLRYGITCLRSFPVSLPFPGSRAAGYSWQRRARTNRSVA